MTTHPPHAPIITLSLIEQQLCCQVIEISGLMRIICAHSQEVLLPCNLQIKPIK